jgi:pimeloyl-ACP methyl ester carboxylesterase
MATTLTLAIPAAASAATPITTDFAAGAGVPCPTYGGQQICSGEVPSFDGAKLDVDLTLPATGGNNTRHPLIVMLHGFGNNKHEWESLTNAGDNADKFDWNSHWFAAHGYYVLTYTARGFQDNGPTDTSYQPATPSGALFGSQDPSSPNGTIHVKSRDYEIRDTQWLAALVAAAYPDVDTGRVAVTGGSYGGGESWMQASQAQWTFPHWQDPTLPVLNLQVAVPKYPWTDLAYALAPNGHGGGPSGHDIYESSQLRQDNTSGLSTPATGNPLGVPKASYIAGLFEEGSTNGMFDNGTDLPPPTNENGLENITAWNTRIVGQGDPYPYLGAGADVVLDQASRGLTILRSAYYQPGWPDQVGKREVAVFSIQGWTDDLFEPIESFRMFKYLKRLDPLWPVSVAVADIGHSPAQNKPDTWHRLNNQAWQFLQSNINGSHRQHTTVSSQATVCTGDPGQNGSGADELTATTPEGLGSGKLSITYAGGNHSLNNPLGVVDPNGPATDPIVGPDVIEPHQGCSTDQGPALGGYTGVSQPLHDQTTYVGLGEVDVHYALTPAVIQAQLDARVWDVPPSGPAYLITRGTYRFDTINGYDTATGNVRLPLFGNEWRLAPGHRIRLDLTQVDQPYLRPNNLGSSITFGTPKLILPTREAKQQSLTGSP